jgi:hypothetical protein
MPAALAFFSQFLAQFPQPPARALPRAAHRLTLDDQWSRLIDLISRPIERTSAGHNLHVAAGNQIDAAAYALNAILDDLSSVMPLPAHRPANLHHLRPPFMAGAAAPLVAAA